MRFLTDFADLAAVLPIAVCIGLSLAWVTWWRGVAAWSFNVMFALSATLVLKLVFLACGPTAGFSPSGHTAAGTAVYGGVAALILRKRIGAPAAWLLAGGSMAALIGYSRMALHLHDLREVSIGAAVGLVAVAAFLATVGPAPTGLRPRALLSPALLVIIPLHGLRLPAEPMVRHAAAWLAPLMCGSPNNDDGTPRRNATIKSSTPNRPQT
jgi:membrane-associated phospholipid phosphatase